MQSPHLLTLYFAMALLSLSSSILEAQCGDQHTQQTGPTRLDEQGEGGKQAFSILPLEFSSVRKGKESFAEIISLGCLVGWSFLCLAVPLAMTLVYKLGEFFISPDLSPSFSFAS